VAAHSAHIGQRGKHPDRRGTKRDNAQRLDDIAGSPPREKVLGTDSSSMSSRSRPPTARSRTGASCRRGSGTADYAALLRAARSLPLRGPSPHQAQSWLGALAQAPTTGML
jgi:hypothetical protein